MGRWRDLWQRFLLDQTGAVCVGCGLTVNAESGVLETKLKTDGGLVCDGDGLHVVFPAGYSPSESPDACNGLEVRGNGLYASCPQAIVGVHQWAPGAITPVTFSTAGAHVFDYPASDAVVTNSTCRTVAGRISSRAGGIRLLTHTGFWCTAELQVNIDGGGWGNAVPDTALVIENQTGADVHYALSSFLDENYLAMAVAQVVTYGVRLHIDVHAGTADATGNFVIEVNWVLPQVGAC